MDIIHYCLESIPSVEHRIGIEITIVQHVIVIVISIYYPSER